jgi:hypothetical protein
MGRVGGSGGFLVLVEWVVKRFISSFKFCEDRFDVKGRHRGE